MIGRECSHVFLGPITGHNKTKQGNEKGNDGMRPSALSTKENYSKLKVRWPKLQIKIRTADKYITANENIEPQIKILLQIPKIHH